MRCYSSPRRYKQASSTVAALNGGVPPNRRLDSERGETGKENCKHLLFLQFVYPCIVKHIFYPIFTILTFAFYNNI